MSAAAARRRKQRALKAAQEAEAAAADNDPVTTRLTNLLSGTDCGESTAYEALQLAQSQVRRYVKSGKYDDATNLAYETSLTLLDRHKRVSVSSQLLMLLAEILVETHTACDDGWLERMTRIDSSYRAALERDEDMDSDERDRLGRLHLQFLRRSLRWSTDLGKIRHGEFVLHGLLGMQCWRMSSSSLATSASAKEMAGEGEGEEDNTTIELDEDVESSIGLMSDAVTHLSLAEKPDQILELLKTLPPPTEEELAMGHACPPSDRDSLLTRGVLLLTSIENLRDANTLLRGYIADCESRDMKTLTKSYMNKQDGVAPSHVVFNSMLLRTCEKDAKTGPLFSWLLRSFNSELNKMFKPDVIKVYTTKIGRVYFGIQPPPSMMSMMENMMNMMGGGGGAAGGMNPAMMQAMMQAQGGM